MPRLCQQTKSLQENIVSFERRWFFTFLQVFCIKSNLQNLSPYGARHKIFGPTCSVASPPTNDSLIFLKKFKGTGGDKLKWGIQKKEKIDFHCRKHLDAVFIFLKSTKLFRIHF